MDKKLPFIDASNGAKSIKDIMGGKAVRLRYPGLLDSRLNFISGFLFRLLSQLDLNFLSEILLVYLTETVSNCSKAIAKRIFFLSKERDINDPAAYESNMPLFAAEVLSDWNGYIKKHKKIDDYYISVTFQLIKENLIIEVEDNIEMNAKEKERIKARLEAFKQTQSMSQIFSRVSDMSEGAGLGIVMSLMLLKNAGIDEENYKIRSRDGKTCIQITIPIHLAPKEAKVKFHEIILGEINELPAFPENIQYLVDQCNSPNSSISDISEGIQKDPGLTAQVLKLVNSAGYISGFKNPGIGDAVKILGLKTLRDLLMIVGARSIIGARYHNLEKIWEGSNRVAFNARKLLKGRTKQADTAALAGLLFELGKIIFLSLKPELVHKIHDLMGAGRIRNSSVIEEIGIGISHPEVGALIAEKWNFPEPLVNAIRYQQKPLAVAEEYKELLYGLNLAIKLYETTVNRSDYYAVEPDILDMFKIRSEEEFAALSEKMSKLYALEGSGV